MDDTKSTDESITIDVFCHNCNVLVATAVVKVHSIAPFSNPDTPYEVVEYTISLCGRCESVFFIKSTYFEIPEPGIPQPDPEVQILYPIHRQVDMNGVPAIIERSYSEACLCFRAGAYNACVIMIRKCVEAICKAFGATEGGLQNKLKYLQKEGKIDKKLLLWANGLRLIGNYAVHDENVDFKKSDATYALDFIDAILMYVFTLDRKFEKFRATHKDSIQSSEE